MTRTLVRGHCPARCCPVVAAFAQPGPDRRRRPCRAARQAGRLFRHCPTPTIAATSAGPNRRMHGMPSRTGTLWPDNFRIWPDGQARCRQGRSPDPRRFQRRRTWPCSWASQPYGPRWGRQDQAWQSSFLAARRRSAPASIGSHRPTATGRQPLQPGRGVGRCVAMFDSIDLDHDGTISLAERDATRAKWTSVARGLSLAESQHARTSHRRTDKAMVRRGRGPPFCRPWPGIKPGVPHRARLSLAAALLSGSVLLAAFGQRGTDGPPRTRAALQGAAVSPNIMMPLIGIERHAPMSAEIDSRQERHHRGRAEGRDNFREWFVARFDADKDGSLSSSELAGEGTTYTVPPRPYGDDALRNQAWHMVVSGDGPGIGTSRRWFRQADTDANGVLTRAEAARGPVSMFDQIDVNHDGIITDAKGSSPATRYRPHNAGRSTCVLRR